MWSSIKWLILVGQQVCDVCPSVCPMIYLSSSISRLDSLSDSCLHRASLRSISLWSFLCSRMFSSLMCRSSSMYWARFSVSVRVKHTHSSGVLMAPSSGEKAPKRFNNNLQSALLHQLNLCNGEIFGRKKDKQKYEMPDHSRGRDAKTALLTVHAAFH